MVAYDILLKSGYEIGGYFELEEKKDNPLGLKYFGLETFPSALKVMKENEYFVSIGDNHIRQQILEFIVENTLKEPVNAIHPSATIAENANFGNGVMVAAGCLINPFVSIGNGVICNTGSIIEHDCKIDSFVHLAPGTVLCGSVEIGLRSFIGANSVIREDTLITNDVFIGAGSIVVKDIKESGLYFGNPLKRIKGQI